MARPAEHHTPEARTASTRAERAKDRRLAVENLAAPEKNAAESGAHLVLIDESGAHLTPLVRRSLAPRGQTPILKTPGRKRQKVSMIAALSMAPRRNRIGLYFRCFPDRHVTQVEAAQFVRNLLKHLRGPVHLVWDRGNTHKGDTIRALHRDYPRLTSHWFPPYAPELNPVEYVWNHAKFGRGANYLARDLPQLHQWLERLLKEARGDPQRKISFFDQAGLPLRSRTLAS